MGTWTWYSSWSSKNNTSKWTGATLLRRQESYHNTSRRKSKWTWSMPIARRQANRLCISCSYQCWKELCTNRERTFSHLLCMHKVSPIHLRQRMRCSERSPSTWSDIQKTGKPNITETAANAFKTTTLSAECRICGRKAAVRCRYFVTSSSTTRKRPRREGFRRRTWGYGTESASRHAHQCHGLEEDPASNRRGPSSSGIKISDHQWMARSQIQSSIWFTTILASQRRHLHRQWGNPLQWTNHHPSRTPNQGTSTSSWVSSRNWEVQNAS